MSEGIIKNKDGKKPAESRQQRRFRQQGLALVIFLTCPLGAFFAWQAGLFILCGIFTALVGLAFVLTVTNR